MSTATPAVPAPLVTLRRNALVVGGVALAAALVGAFFDPTQFLRSYLLGFLFWAGIAVGCLSIAFITRLTGGAWGAAVSRLLEAGTRTVVWTAFLFIPVLLGLSRLYVWAQPEVVAGDPLLQHKALYLNPVGFVVRAVFYFAVWAALAHFLNRWSWRLDESLDPVAARQVGRRLRGLAGGGILLLGLTITFSSIDWAMSLDPHWFSTIYGLIFMVGQVLSAFTLVILLVSTLGGEVRLREAIPAQTIHDLGKLLLAFVMLWAYIHLSQFLITWSGNLPEETPWYLNRLQGGWQHLARLLIALHFVLPFLLLLSRDLKRDVRRLAFVAGLLFVMRFVDLYWLVAPAFGAGKGFAPHWLDVATPLGLGGLWMAAFARELGRRPLLPAAPVGAAAESHGH